MSYIDLALRNPPNFKGLFIGGTNLAADTAAYELIGPDMGVVGSSFVLPSSPAALTAVSANVGDTGLLYVEYIDGDWYERGATVTMTGTTPVQIAAAALRVNRAVYLPGSNLGEISLKVNTTKVNAIGAGDGISGVAIYTAPRGQRVRIITASVNFQVTKDGDGRLMAHSRGKAGFYKIVEKHGAADFTIGSAEYPRRLIDFQGQYGLTIWIDAKLTQGTGHVGGHFQLLAQRTTDGDAPGYDL